MIWLAKQTLRAVVLYGLLVVAVNVLSTPLPGLPGPLARSVAHTVQTAYAEARSLVAQTVCTTSPTICHIGAAALRTIDTSRPVVELSAALRAALERNLARPAAHRA